jgi:hypothetical protein
VNRRGNVPVDIGGGRTVGVDATFDVPVGAPAK